MSTPSTSDATPGPVEGATIVMAAPARMMTMNWERNTHHFKKAEVVGAWRLAAKVAAWQEKIGSYDRVDIECWPSQKRGVLADTAAHTPVVKACVDGLRDAGVLSDDTGAEVASITMHAPVRGPDGVRLSVREHVEIQEAA